MVSKAMNAVSFEVPEEIILSHYADRLPDNFGKKLQLGLRTYSEVKELKPTLYTAHLPEVLDWLHGMDMPKALENEPCDIPVLLFDKELSTEKLLFHYDGTPASAKLIKNFIHLFQDLIKDSKATIISPSFIPKSKLKEELEIVNMVNEFTAEASFIKFNFNRIGDFWSYAVKHECTLLVTTKYYQADLAKVLFHFYKGGMWYDRLSFYLSF